MVFLYPRFAAEPFYAHGAWFFVPLFPLFPCFLDARSTKRRWSRLRFGVGVVIRAKDERSHAINAAPYVSGRRRRSRLSVGGVGVHAPCRRRERRASGESVVRLARASCVCRGRRAGGESWREHRAGGESVVRPARTSCVRRERRFGPGSIAYTMAFAVYYSHQGLAALLGASVPLLATAPLTLVAPAAAAFGVRNRRGY